jgi:hypothetical protein
VGRVHKDALLDPIPDNDYIDYSKAPRPWETESDANYLSPTFHESVIPGEMEQNRKLVEKYRDVFSLKLNPIPAKLKPMKLSVNDLLWRTEKNRRPARPQSDEKRREIERQVQKMLDEKLIRPSQAAYWSQVILAPKPNGQWRFCIDYRALNEITEAMGWPIPNMEQTFHRIGQEKPKYFAVLDLTSGFFQAPLDEQSSKYSAFITWMGLFEWLRVPMGLKGAPSWFQQQLATEVLGGLLHRICELYIDDLIVYGRTFEEYIERLELVFQRLREHGITINPEKAKFLMTEVEYLGYKLDKEGIEFSQENKEKALDFELPPTYKTLKSFVGFAERFHRHIRDFHKYAQPLHALLRGYNALKNKSTLINWTDEPKQAFYDLQRAIGGAQKLHFVDTSKEIFLQTDASNYGIGAYLYQISEKGEEVPISMISKALVNEQLNWSVPEKEAFAIFYAFCKLEHILPDTHFVIQMDHKNLTYINYGNSAKVLRWKLWVQEFDFSLEYTKGEENEIADILSRGMKNPSRGDKKTHTVAHILATGVKNPAQQSTTQHELYTFPEFKPTKYQYDEIKKVHNTSVGHYGVEKTVEKLHEKNERWSNMREHVRHFIKACPCCQKMSMLKIPIHTHPFVVGTYTPMKRVAVDTIGPLPTDDMGCSYIIVMIDCFSRYTKLVPAKDATALSAAKALLWWIAEYGEPNQLLSDMGSQYVNQTINELVKFTDVEKLDTMPGIHEENSIVERRNKEVMRHLRAIVNHKKIKAQWSDSLPIVQRILNSERMDGLQASPAQIIYGRSVDLDGSIFLKKHPDTGETLSQPTQIKRLSDWMARMLITRRMPFTFLNQVSIFVASNLFTETLSPDMNSMLSKSRLYSAKRSKRRSPRSSALNPVSDTMFGAVEIGGGG